MKNPEASEHGKIYLHDIGDYLSQNDKLERISEFASIDGITATDGWKTIVPDTYNDWVGQRDDSFYEFMSLGDKKDKTAVTVFENYSCGVQTNRDAWIYNSSKEILTTKMKSFISFYNSELVRYEKSKEAEPNLNIKGFLNTDERKIKWSSSLVPKLAKGIAATFTHKKLTKSLYRPFSKQWMYFDAVFNHRPYQMPQIFPDASVENRVICLTITGKKDFTVIITEELPDLHLIGDAQCFPLKLYEPMQEVEQHSTGLTPQTDLFSNQATGVTSDLFEQAANALGYTSRDGIIDAGLAHFQEAYPDETFSKEDLFYYIYGLLHSEDYKSRYAANLTKELPRIPAVKQAADFWAFSKAGRELAELHINYETQPKHAVTLDCVKRNFDALTDADFYVTKMKFAKKGDKSVVVYNPSITIRDIPLEAYEYVVNGKPALEWVMERQSVTTHKASGIVNDANDWAIETMGNAKYPLELFQRVVAVSLRTVEIVKGLPELDI